MLYKVFAINESDRRKMERFDLKLPTKLSWKGKDNELKSIELMTSNICAGGVFFKTGKALLVETIVKLDIIYHLDKFKSSKWEISHIEFSGSVIRTDKKGMAICFDEGYKISPYMHKA